ncbi:MAG: STAS domain-containing protein, partial [Lachnospiraceae bacterium]|nr:STAS domain-containing protein [Lachnospiraceae bacterium]
GLNELTLDIEKLEYISSAGLRVLLSAQKIMSKQGEMKVIHVNETIMEIFEVTGFSEILTIE